MFTNLRWDSLLEDKEQQKKYITFWVWLPALYMSADNNNLKNHTISRCQYSCSRNLVHPHTQTQFKDKLRNLHILILLNITKELPAHIWIQIWAVLSPWHRFGALTASFVLYQCAPTDSCWETDKITPLLICYYH